MEKLNEVGERIWNMERDFNNRAGFTAKDDNLPPRLLKEAAQDGPGQGPRQRPRQDAAGVLRAARLDAGRRADQRDHVQARTLTLPPALPAPWAGGGRLGCRNVQKRSRLPLTLALFPSGMDGGERGQA